MKTKKMPDRLFYFLMDIFEEYIEDNALYGGADAVITDKCFYFDNDRDYYRVERHILDLEREALIRDEKYNIVSSERKRLTKLLDYFEAEDDSND